MRLGYQYKDKEKFPLPSDYVPKVFQSHIIAEAIREAQLITQTPESMVLLTAISYASLALQGSINVEMPIGKIRPVSIMSMIIAESGERKSSLENLLSKGIKLFQKDILKKDKIQQNRYKILQDIHKKNISNRKVGKFK